MPVVGSAPGVHSVGEQETSSRAGVHCSRANVMWLKPFPGTARRAHAEYENVVFPEELVVPWKRTSTEPSYSVTVSAATLSGLNA